MNPKHQAAEEIKLISSKTVAESLTELKVELIAAWRNRVRKEVYDKQSYRDGGALNQWLPALVDFLSDSLAKIPSQTHLQDGINALVRWDEKEQIELEKYSPEEVSAEFRILRQMIFESLERNGLLSPEARDAILDIIHFASQKIMAVYHQKEQRFAQACCNELEAIKNSIPVQAFRILFEAVPGLYLVMRPDLRIVAASDTYLQATLTHREKIFGKYVFDAFPDDPLTHEQGPQRLRASLERVLRSKKRDSMAIQKYSIKRPDGTFEVRYWSPINMPVLDEKGEIEYIIHRVEDMTEFKLGESQQEGNRKLLHDIQGRIGQMEAEIYKRANEIQLARQELDDFFMQAPIGMCLLSGPEHRYVWVNPSFIQTSGRVPIGKTVKEAFKQEEVSHYIKLLDEVYQTRIPYVGREIPFSRQNEKGEVTELFLDVDFHPFRAPTGEIRGIMAFVQDATERVQAKRAENDARRRAEQAEQRFEIAAQVVKVGVWELDLKTKKFWRNSSHDSLYGYPILQENWTIEIAIEHACPEDRQKIAGTLNQAMSTPGRYQWGFCVNRADGNSGWLVSHAETFADDSGKPSRIIGVTEDVTDRKRAEEALRTSEERLRQAIEATGVGVWEVDPITLKSWRTISHDGAYGLDYSPDRSLDFFFSRIHPEERDRIRQMFESSLKTGVCFTAEYRFIRPNGSIGWMWVEGRGVKDATGQVVKSIGTNQDITKRKSAEEQLKQSLLELTEERELREQFVATLTHDLRSPLTVIKTSARVLERIQEGSPEMRKLISRIHKSIDRTNHMISNLLDANLIQAGESLPIVYEECDLKSILQSVIEDLTSVCGKRFIFRSDGTFKGQWGSDAIQRILENLFSNAIKYGAPDRPIAITLKQQRSSIEMAVHNEGSPIALEEQATLFEPFRRSKAAEVGKQLGWGLGLTLVRGLVAAQGGVVRVESSPDKGTTFRVELPDLRMANLEREFKPSL